MNSLRNEAYAAQSLLQALQAEQGELDEETNGLVIASETNLVEAIEAALVANAEDDAHVKTLDMMIGAFESRRERKKARIERRRGAIMTAMEIAGVQKLELAAATVSVSKGRPKVIITEEALIPTRYLGQKVTFSPSKGEIQKALEAGLDVPGAVLSNPMPILQVRTR